MFSKTKGPSSRPSEAPANAPAARRPGPPRVASLLGPDLIFEGWVSGDGELHVEGVIRGGVNVTRVVVGESACIEGEVRGGQVEVRGRVVGNIEAKTVKLYATARVEGDIVHEQLSIDAGAAFEGRCRQQQSPADQAPAPVGEPTLKLITVEKTAEPLGSTRPSGRTSRLSWRPPSGPATQP